MKSIGRVPARSLTRAIWLACLASIGLGAWIAYGIRPGEKSPDVAVASIPAADNAEALPVDVRQHKQSPVVRSTPAVSEPPPAVDQPPRWNRQKSTDFNAEATMYARTFQPGLTLDDSLPPFVAQFEGAVGGTAISDFFRDHRQLPVDEWSTDAEFRLRRFFEAQPEISMTRVSISCRTTRCLLQFIELPLPQAGRQTGRSNDAMKMLLRLKQESWYPEVFADSDRKLTTPARGEAVQFMVQILMQR